MPRRLFARSRKPSRLADANNEEFLITAPSLPGPYPCPVDEMPRDHRPAKSVRVLLAEDQGMMRGALALLLGMEPDLEVVAPMSPSSTSNSPA